MPQIKFVYFDVGDVLFKWKVALRKMAVMTNKSYEEVYAVFNKYDDDACRGKISPQEFWGHFKEELVIEDNKIENFLQWWADCFSPIDAIHELVKDASRKYKVGILTNIYPGAWEYYVADGLIPDVSYDTIVQSCDIGSVKPEDEIYRYAQDKAGVSPQEILFVDNSQKNIDKAKELKWQAVWYDVENSLKSEREIREILDLNL